MIKQEVIEKIINYFNLPQYEAEKIYDEFFSIVMQGVKDDQIVNLQGFGEFILKDTNGNGEDTPTHGITVYKKTVEFLQSLSLGDELSAGVYEAIKNISPQLPVEEHYAIPGEKEKELPVSSVEEELKQKREALLNKISIQPLQEAGLEKDSKLETPVVKVPPSVTSMKEIPFQESKTNWEEQASNENLREKEPEPEKAPQETYLQGGEDMSKKSFSDYFAEVEKEPGQKSEEISQPLTEIPSVIPQSAVDLHNEIVNIPAAGETGSHVDTGTTLETRTVPGPVKEDKSYYIWYKDSEPNLAETLNLSLEYELLYQATKEAEYKSKLKIYVSSFIVFFSIVLILLIFSPVLYKFFFTQIEYPGITQQESNNTPEQKATPNVLQQTQTSEQLSSTNADTTGRQLVTQTNTIQSQQQTETKQIEQPKQVQQTGQIEEPKIDGVTKNAMGWVDEKYNVVYIKLDNGKYAIQESAFDSDSKASKRIAIVESYKIQGLVGSSVKTDLGAKGTWYRVRFGEFQSIQEARSKAEELRSKVKI